MKSISSLFNRGKVVANVSMAYQGTSITTRFLMALVLGIQRFSGLAGLLGMQVLGVVANTMGARYYGKIPCRNTIAYKKGRGVFVLFREAMQDASFKRRLLLRWLSSAIIVIFGLSVPFLQKELHLSADYVMLYSVVLGLSAVLASVVGRQFADRLGSRPLVVLSSLFSLVFLVLWVLLSPGMDAVWFFVIGFLANFFISLNNLLDVRLVAQVMPDDESVSFNAMVNFVIAIVAFLVGLFSGVLADLGERISLLPSAVGNGYSLVFLFAVLLTVIEVLVAMHLVELGSYTSQAAAAIIFSLHGLRAVSMIEKLEKISDPSRRRALMFALGHNRNDAATGEMRSILSSPFSTDKREAVMSLADHPRLALLPDLIRIAKDDDSYVQLDAIAALGSYRKRREVREALVHLLLHGRWSSVRSMAAKSLARISEGPEYLAVVNELSLSARHIDEEIDFLVAKRFMDDQGTFYRDVFLSVGQRRSPTFRQTRYAVLSSFLKFGSPRLAYFYGLLNNGGIEDFLSAFLTESRDLIQIDDQYESVENAFRAADWSSVFSFCQGILKDCPISSDACFNNLKRGLQKAADMDSALFDVQDAVAMLYFSYSLGKNLES